MSYGQAKPTPALRHAVLHYWLLTLPREAGAQSIQRIYPDGHCEMVIHLGDPVLHQPNCLWVGQMREAINITPTGRLRVFGIRFRPEASLLVAPTTNAIVDAAAVMPYSESLRQRLGEVETVAEMASIGCSPYCSHRIAAKAALFVAPSLCRSGP
jgi:hypothetical protein